MPETMKLFGSIKILIQNKKGEKVPGLEVIEVVLAQCNLQIISINKSLKY